MDGDGGKMSEYERDRLKRIEENRKKLKELFPEGIGLRQRGRRRRERERTPEGSEREGSAGSSSYGSPVDHVRRTRRSLVTPRRNPSRKSRLPLNGSEDSFDYRPITRSMTKNREGVPDASLVEGMRDEQEMRREVLRSRKRRHSEEEEPVEISLDDKPVCQGSKVINVAVKVTDKVYDRVNGTTCHQCRQKTTDTKTLCHNLNCRGVRGQFCGPCLANRYGEDIRETLLDKKWVCPPCRRICNCSFCLPKRGRAPTGIMIHEARDRGYNSVMEFLEKSDYDY